MNSPPPPMTEEELVHTSEALAIGRRTNPVEPPSQSPTGRPHCVTSPASKPSVKIELGLSNR